MFRTVKWIAALTAGFSSWVTAAEAETTVPAGWLDSQRNERGQACEQHGSLAREASVLIACGAAGVWEVAVSEQPPRLVKSYELGDAVGFLTATDGAVWVKLRVIEARPLLGAPAGTSVLFTPSEPPLLTPPAPPAKPAPASPPPPPALVPKPSGRVLRSRPGEVIISLGSADGLLRSDRIELALDAAPENELDTELGREVLAVGVVTHVSPHSARVRLGLNERVPQGSVATRSRAAITGGIVAPERVSELWELELMGRPFAAIGELGGGVLLSASIGYRFASNWRVRAVLDPVGFADVDRDEAIGVGSGTLLGSYDSHYVEMGLGLGAQTVNDAGFELEPGSGLSFSQLLRLGAHDGLNITARTSVVLFHSQFDFGGMTATGQIPVSRGYWLLLGGGGGDVGFGYGELGLRVLMSGNGFSGSKFLTVTAGGAAVFRSQPCNQFTCGSSRAYGGPMAGIGGEWRW